jgi:hypothetical protein
MLEALKEFIEDIRAGSPDLKQEWPDLYVTYQHARAAIAKAEGRS